MYKNTINRIVNESLNDILRRRLNEDDYDVYDDDLDFDAHDSGEEDDDYTDDLVRSVDRKNRKELGLSDDSNFFGDVRRVSSPNGKKNDSKVDTGESDFDDAWQSGSEGFSFDFDDEEEEGIDSAEDNGLPNVKKTGDELYDRAMEDLQQDDGHTSMKAWVDGMVEDGYDKNECEQAFMKAKNDYSALADSYEEDTVQSFDSRGFDPSEGQENAHKAGNVIEHDGVQITDDGKQYTMVAKENEPQITIKGSNLNDVINTYERLWNNFSNMEELARSIGYTVYHGAWLLAKDYDSFVRAAGAHEEGLPIIIDLDKDSNANEGSWIERYKQPNGKYQITKYQLSQLPDEQRREWEKLSRTNPSKYSIYYTSGRKNV